MFISKLNTVKNELTPAEKIVAEYMLANLDKIKLITSLQLAEQTKIAQSTIIRFSKKLGYHSFRELLADLSNESNKKVEEEILVQEDTSTTLFKIAQQYHDITDITLQMNKASTLEDCVRQITDSSSILLFGVGSSNLYCEYLANQLIKMGIACLTSNSAHTIYSLIDNSPQHSTLFLISESGETTEIVKAAELAKEKGIVVIAMTRSGRNSLHQYADILLKTVSFQTKTRLNVTTMRCSQLYLIDVLYLLILKSDFKKYNHAIERSEILAGNQK